MPGCARRRGTSLGTSTCRSSGESDTVFRAALISSMRRLGRYFGFQVPDSHPDCDVIPEVYKKCVMENEGGCDYFVKRLTKNCPSFNAEEFLRTLSSSGQRDK